MVAAGLRPVDCLDKLTDEEWNRFCRFYDFDADRDKYEMPCNSWHVKDRHGTMVPVAFHYCELQRGAITREEYHRRVLELAGLPVPADSASGSGPPSEAVSDVAATCSEFMAGSSSSGA